MPQQPKITDDLEVDSWTLQVTQELNDLNTFPEGQAFPPNPLLGDIFYLRDPRDPSLTNIYRWDGTAWIMIEGGSGIETGTVLPPPADSDLGAVFSLTAPAADEGLYVRGIDGPNPVWLPVGGGGIERGTTLPRAMGEIGDAFVLTEPDGDYGEDLYIRIGNGGTVEDWNRVGRADAPVPIVFPEPVTLTERVTYRLGFTAGQVGTGRGNVVGFSSGNNLIGFDFGTATGTTNMPAVGAPADTSANTYAGNATAGIAPGDQIDFSSINLSLPTAAQWANLRGATAGTATNLSWAFWTGTGQTNRGTQLGFRIPHPALISETNPISPASWPARFPYAPIVAAAGSIRVRIVGIDDPTYIVTINYTPSTALPWNTYNSDNTVSHVQSNRGSRVVTPSGTTGGITFSPNRTHRPFVNGHRYEVLLTMNGTFDAEGVPFTAPTLPTPVARSFSEAATFPTNPISGDHHYLTAVVGANPIGWYIWTDTTATWIRIDA